MIEARSINIEDLRETREGFRITFRSSKEKQEIKMRSFLVPSQCETPYAKRLKEYLEKLQKETGVTEGPLFRGCNGGKCFVKSPLGKCKLANVGKDMAKFLKLPNANRYTGHCFRRTAATNASANSASTTNLQSHFGWSNEKTALQYIEANEKNQDVMAEKITGERPKTENVELEHKEAASDLNENTILVTKKKSKKLETKRSRKSNNDDEVEESEEDQTEIVPRKKNRLSLKNRKVRVLKRKRCETKEVVKNVTITIN